MLFNHSITVSQSLPVSHYLSVSQSVSRSINQSVSKSVSQQSIIHPSIHSFRQEGRKAGRQGRQAAIHSFIQSVSQSVSQCTYFGGQSPLWSLLSASYTPRLRLRDSSSLRWSGSSVPLHVKDCSYVIYLFLRPKIFELLVNISYHYFLNTHVLLLHPASQCML